MRSSCTLTSKGSSTKKLARTSQRIFKGDKQRICEDMLNETRQTHRRRINTACFHLREDTSHHRLVGEENGLLLSDRWNFYISDGKLLPVDKINGYKTPIALNTAYTRGNGKEGKITLSLLYHNFYKEVKVNYLIWVS